MKTLIRRRVLRHLIWFCTVCLCPKNGMLGLYGLKDSTPNHSVEPGALPQKGDYRQEINLQNSFLVRKSPFRKNTNIRYHGRLSLGFLMQFIMKSIIYLIYLSEWCLLSMTTHLFMREIQFSLLQLWSESVSCHLYKRAVKRANWL